MSFEANAIHPADNHQSEFEQLVANGRYKCMIIVKFITIIKYIVPGNRIYVDVVIYRKC